MKPLPKRFFARSDVDQVARELIGVELSVGAVSGIIVETESYDPTDAASHSYGARRTARNAVMFGPPGHAYVYFIYGMYWCLNFVCTDASAVLIRALEPTEGLGIMRRRRGASRDQLLCSGPGRLCQALGIDGTFNGLSLFEAPFALRRGTEAGEIASGTRIGITKAAELERRFGRAGSPYLSKRFP
ncbi:MAG TPA: DNA-3-methyladenine glycosylase [Rhizomicrobium sp.]|nr:DNA-3-methyladenine glycosylase [Rhizomicrobium sp.]